MQIYCLVLASAFLLLVFDFKCKPGAWITHMYAEIVGKPIETLKVSFSAQK